MGVKRGLMVGITANVDVDKPSLLSSKKILDNFYDEYANKEIELGVDNKELQQNIRQSATSMSKYISALGQYMSKYKSITSSVGSWLDFDDMQADFANVIPMAKKYLEDVRVIFNDGTELFGFDEIVDKFEQNAIKGLKSIDLGGQLELIKQDAADIFADLETMFKKRNDGTLIFSDDMFDADKLEHVIGLLQKLAHMQDAISLFSSKELKDEDFASKESSKYLKRVAKGMQQELDDMQKYNLQTVRELKNRKSIIQQFENDLSSEGFYIDEAIDDVSNEKRYQENIDTLQSYVDQKKALLQYLSEFRHLFLYNDEGIYTDGDYADEMEFALHGQIAMAEDYLKQLTDARKKLNQPGDDGIIDIGLTNVIDALKEIKGAIEDISKAFSPLTDAMNDGGSAFARMISASASEVDGLIQKFSELHGMVDAINQKDFNVTNVYDQRLPSKLVDEMSLVAYQEKATEMLNVIKILQQTIGTNAKFAGATLFNNGSLTEYGKLFTGLGGDQKKIFDDVAMSGKIASAATVGKIKDVIGQISVYFNAIVEAAKSINSLNPDTIDLSILDTIKKADEKIASVGMRNTGAQTPKPQQQAIETKSSQDKALSDVKELGAQVSTELTTIRQQIESVFDFSTIAPNYEAIQAITDKIYNYFVDLQRKVSGIEFKLNINDDIGPDYGYHAGDLGKSDYYSQMSGGRHTGHFGTGSYFVSNPDKLKGYNKRNGVEAPIEDIDFKKYNLFKPSDTQSAYDLHRALSEINNDLKSMHQYDDINLDFLDKAVDDVNENEISNFISKYLKKDALDKYTEDALDYKEVLERNIDIDKIREEVKKGYVVEDDEWGPIDLSEDDEFKDQVEQEVKRRVEEAKIILESFNLNKEIIKRAIEDIKQGNFEGINSAKSNKDNLVSRLASVLTGHTTEEISKALDETFNIISKYTKDELSKADSASTVFMKKLGYEGVDVRHTDLDNTAYGSVVYDLKGKDLQRRKEILNSQQRSASTSATAITKESEALEEVAESAKEAAQSKQAFADANREVKQSADSSTPSIQKEAEALAKVEEEENKHHTWTAPRTKGTLEGLNLPTQFVGENGQSITSLFAQVKSQIEEMTSKPVTIDFTSKVNEDGQLEAVGATLKYINEESGVTIRQFYDIAKVTEATADGEREIIVATQSAEKAILGTAKAAKVFNSELQKDFAKEQIATLESQMGDLKLDLTDVKDAAENINDKASLDEFNLQLKIAKEQVKQLKAGLKGQNSLDTVAAAEKSLLALPDKLEVLRQKLKSFGDVEGTDAVKKLLDDIEDAYKKFNSETDANKKVDLFKNITSNMVKANASMEKIRYSDALADSKELGKLEERYEHLSDSIEKYKNSLKLKPDASSAKDAQGIIDNIESYYNSLNTLDKNDLNYDQERLAILKEIDKLYGQLQSKMSLVNTEQQTANAEASKQKKEYDDLERKQKSLYDLKTKLAKAEYGSANAQNLADQIAKEESALKQEIEASEYKNKLKEREIQLEKDLQAVKEDRHKKEEEEAWRLEEKRKSEESSAWSDHEAWQKSQNEKEDIQMRKELEMMDKDVASREKEEQNELDALIQKQKHLYDLKMKLAKAEYGSANEKNLLDKIAAEEENLRAEIEESAHKNALKEHEIQLEKDLKAIRDDRIRHEMDDAFDADKRQREAEQSKDEKAKSKQIESAWDEIDAPKREADEADRKQMQKELEQMYGVVDARTRAKEEELNALYQERQRIISNIAKYDNDVRNAKNDRGRAAAESTLEAEKARLQTINQEIAAYGDLVDAQKLSAQDDKLVESVRNNSYANYIKSETEAENDRVKKQKEQFAELRNIQKQYYDELNKFTGSESGSEVESRHLERAIELEEQLNNAKKNTVLTQEQSIQLQKEEAKYKESLKDTEAKNADDKSKNDFKNIRKLYSEYLKSQEAIQKMELDTSGKDHTAQLELENAISAKRKEELLKLGVDINNIESNAVLTQKQKNALLEDEVKHREKMQKINANEQSKYATKQQKEQEKLDRQNKNYGKSIYNSAQRKYDKTAAEMDVVGIVDPKVIAQLEAYKNKLQELQDIRNKFANDANAASDDGLRKQFNATAIEADNLRQSIQDIINEAKKLDAIADEDIFGTGEVLDTSNIDNIKADISSLVDALFKGKAEITGWSQDGKQAFATFKSGSGAVEHVTVALKEGTNQLIAYRSAAKATGTAMGSLKSMFGGELVSFISQSIGIHEMIQLLRTGVESVRELDSAMTELKKVTNETDVTYDKFLSTASKTAGEIGTTLTEFVRSTADFARLGHTIEDAAALAKAASIYSNIGDGVEDIEQATNSIISTMQAFGMETSDAMSIVDKFNEIGNKFAITSGGIGDALQVSASALYEAGNTIDESIALITTANSVVQNPNVVGTALKTLSLRLRGAKVELEEAGLETDNMAESTATLQKKLKALTHGKVDIMADADTFKNTTQILREMSEVWEDMTDIEQASALELMGGKRQANVLSAIISNWDMAEDAITASLDSQNSAIEENAKYMDSIQGRIDKFNNAKQTMWANFLDDELIKTVVNFGTTVIQILDKIGVGWTSLLGIISSAPLAIAFKSLTTWIQDAEGSVTLLGSLSKGFSGLGTSIANIGKAILTFASAHPVLAALIVALPLVIKGFDELVTTSEEVAQAAEEAKKAIADISSEFKANEQAVTGLAERFAELAQSVDILSGKNISLNAEDYEEFLNLSNQLADIFPTLSRNYDENGNAIVQLSGDTDTIVGSLRNLLDVQRQLANQEIVDNIPDLYKGVKQKSEGFKSDIEEMKTRRVAYEEELKLIQQAVNSDNLDGLLDGNILRVTSDDPEALFDIAASYAEMLEKAGIQFEELTPSYGNENQIIGFNYVINADQVEDAKEQIRSGMHKLAQTYSDEITNLNNQISNKAQQNKANWGSLLSSISSWLSTDTSYRIMSDEMQSTVQTIINNMDFSSLNFKSWEDLQSYIHNNILSIFTDPDVSKTLTDSITGMFDLKSKLQSDNMLLNVYKEQMLSFVDNIKKSGLSEDVQNQILSMFDIDPANANSLGESIDAMINHAKSLVDQGMKDQIFKLNYSDFEIMNNAQFNVDGSAISSWDQLQTEILETKKLITADFTTDNFADYSESVKAISENIATYKEALESLEDGTFTMSDFMELIEQFPDLAKGVDVSSKSFSGLSKNLKKAIRNSPDDLVEELEDLRDQLIEAGKSTDAIDQLIASLEDMPSNAFDDAIDDVITLEEQFSSAKRALSELQEAMSENPNEGFEVRGEAVEQMKTLMEQGMIGSESELWSIAEAFGFTYDSAKTINENADALHKFLIAREKWYATDDDGNHTYDGTKSFMNAVTAATKSDEWEKVLGKHGLTTEDFKWSFDGKTLDFDFDNAKWDQIVAALSEMPGLIGLTSEEWKDLLVQVGQFFDINWQDADDISEYITNIANGSGTTTEKLDDMTKTVEKYAEKVLGTNLDLDNLTLEDIANLKMPEDMNSEEFEKVVNLLKTYLDLKDSFKDPFDIDSTLAKSGLNGLTKIEDLQGSIKKNADGTTVIDEDAFRNVLTDAGYAKEAVDEYIKKIQELQKIEYQQINDPLGIKDTEASIESVLAALDKLGIVANEVIDRSTGETIGIKIVDIQDFVTTLKEKGWTKEKISEYINTLTSKENGISVAIDGVEISKEGIDAAVTEAFGESESIPAKINYEIGTQAEPEDKDARVNYVLGEQAGPITAEALVNYTLGAQANPEEANALVNYLIGTQADPSAANALVNYLLGTQSDPAAKTALVDYLLGAQVNPNDAEALVNYLLGTQASPSEASALVNYLLGTQANPETAGAFVNYLLGEQADPVAASALVNYLLGTQVVPNAAEALVNYLLGKQDEPIDKTATVTYIVEYKDSQPPANIDIKTDDANGAVEEIYDFNDATIEAATSASNMWQEYADNQEAIDMLDLFANKQTILTNKEAEAYGIEIDESGFITVEQALEQLQEKQTNLENGIQLQVQLITDNIDSEISALENEINNIKADPTIEPEIKEEKIIELKSKIQQLQGVKVVIDAVFESDSKEAESDIENLTEGINIPASVEVNDESLEALELPEDKSLQVAAILNSQDVDNWTPDNKEADTIYNINDSAVDSWQPPVKYGTVKYKASGGSGGGEKHSATVNGTAHASGTAFKNGSWGATSTETALVGELGPEMLVRNGRWTTIGENGAEFTDIRKGDIIFNHKQTEQLLSNGYITGRGKAYAEGTAFASGGGSYTKYQFSDTSSSISSSAKSSKKSKDDKEDNFEEIFDWIEVRIEEIMERIDLWSAKLENAIGSAIQNSIIDSMIAANKDLYNNLIAGAAKYEEFAAKLLNDVPAGYREAVKNGTIDIQEFKGEDQEGVLEAIEKYREWVQKGTEATQQAEETLTEIADLAKQAVDNIAQEYENKRSIPEGKISQLEAYNDLVATTIGEESAEIYKALMKENSNNISMLAEQRDAMQAELNKRVEAGEIKKYSDAWYEVINNISEVDTEIIELTTDVNDLQDEINELHWDHFDNLVSRLEAISNEADNLIDILGAKDIIDKDTAEWTDEGTTSLGLYAQQLENAEMQASKYAEEIKYLNDNWEQLGYTEQEYVEKLEDLKDGQYDAIKAYNDTKDAIVDLNKERVDAIKDGIEKEIEAYQELIEVKKEELSAEKDLYDFQRNVANQNKNIEDIQRKLQALAADNSASARAQRAKLQAELAKAEQELQDTYYDRSVQDQQEYLDKELENFQKEKDAEMEAWDEYLENTELVVSESLALIQANTDTVYQTLQAMGQEYSLSIAEAITSPWADGAEAIQAYSEQFGLSMSSTVEELKRVSAEYQSTMDEIENYGNKAVTTVNTNAQTYQAEPKTTTTNAAATPAIVTGGKINAGSAKIYDHYGDTSGEKQYYSNDPIYDVLAVKGDWVQVRHRSLKSGVTGWFKKSDSIKAYAKGTTGVKQDQFALIDELGEELVIRPSNGRMTFLEKGSGVIPADLTANLMEWGSLDPSVMLDQNKPKIEMSPSVVNNNVEINIDSSIGELIHVDNMNGNNIAEVTKIVDKAWDKYMKELNGHIRRYVK